MFIYLIPTCLYLHLFITFIFLFLVLSLPTCLYLYLFTTFIFCVPLFSLPDIPTYHELLAYNYTGLAKLSPLAENCGQNVRGQTVLAKLSVAKLSGHHLDEVCTCWPVNGHTHALI